MSERNHNHLTNHIKNVLRGHEEPYAPGAWEHFRRRRQQKQRIRNRALLFRTAATVLLILTMVFGWSRVDQTTSDRFAGRDTSERPAGSEPQAQQPAADPSPELVPADQNGDAVTEENRNPNRHAPETPRTASGNSPAIRPKIFNREILTASLPVRERLQRESRFLPDGKEPAGQKKFTELTPEQEKKPSGYDILVGSPETSTRNDLVFSLAYASIMNMHHAQTDFGFGGGLFADWNFSKKTALTSGMFVSRNQLMYDNPGALATMRTEHTLPEEPDTGLNSSTSMQVDLVSLEIPLNLRYHITDRFSVAGGISSISYLKENYDYTFEYEQRIQTFETTEDNQVKPVTRIVTLTETLKESEPALKTLNWAAFYTFSAGYRHELPGRLALSVEPFLKIPAGQAASRDIRYTTGGLQMRISF